MNSGLDPLPYRSVWCVDFEFQAPPGEQQMPVCMVAIEARTGRKLRLWRDELAGPSPITWDKDSVLVAFYASAEIGCLLSLGWQIPIRVLDLFAEFRNLTNGRTVLGTDGKPITGAGLLSAMTAFGLDTIAATEKSEMRELVIRGGPWSDEERAEILDYCESDVAALVQLLPAMLPYILRGPRGPRVALGQALLRGRYMAAAAAIEHRGIPIDMDCLRAFREHWDDIRLDLIAEVDQDFGVFDGLSFSTARFSDYLVRTDTPWPRLVSGALDLKDQTFRDMARAYPHLAPLRELRAALSEMRLNDLAVGGDGRNRTLLSAFRARSGRNAPSNTRFVFGPAVWLRGLIRPRPGHAIAYIDFKSQEIGIAAALSGDVGLQADYAGDPYLDFGKRASLLPADATKQTHGPERDMLKAVVLGTNYGMGEYSLAMRINRPVATARDLLRKHRQAYPKFWQWSEGAVDRAFLHRQLQTVFGWTLHVEGDANPRTVSNFPMQGNGAEMLRLACCMAVEAGLGVIAPVHDAIAIEAPADRIADDVAQLKAVMEEASRLVLDGFTIDAELDGGKLIVWPERYMDKRGALMWDRVCRLVDQRERRGWQRWVCANQQGGVRLPAPRPSH